MKFKNIKSLWASVEVFNLLQVNNTISYVLVKDFSNNVYGVPNFLTGRIIELDSIKEKSSFDPITRLYEIY